MAPALYPNSIHDFSAALCWTRSECEKWAVFLQIVNREGEDSIGQSFCMIQSTNNIARVPEGPEGGKGQRQVS